jgi:hypothetical protein
MACLDLQTRYVSEVHARITRARRELEDTRDMDDRAIQKLKDSERKLQERFLIELRALEWQQQV